MSTSVFKIFRADEWARFQQEQRFEGSADDRRDGFIHLSTREQVPATLARHFANEKDLVIAEFSTSSWSSALRWETSRGGARFPHLYGALSLEQVLGHAPAAQWPEDELARRS